jgi:hypothetical protein
MKRFPAHRSTNDLREPDVLQSLHDRVNAPVRVDKLPNGKLCLVTRMRAAQFPASYSIDKFRLPGEARLLAFPLGTCTTRWAACGRRSTMPECPGYSDHRFPCCVVCYLTMPGRRSAQGAACS